MSIIKYNSSNISDSLEQIKKIDDSLDKAYGYLTKCYGAESKYVNIEKCKEKIVNSDSELRILYKWLKKSNESIETVLKSFNITINNLGKVTLKNRNKIVN